MVAVAAISTSASAFDYKINLEGRADFNHDNVKTTTAAGGEASGQANNFMTNLIRLNLAGSINENLTYRFRYRFQNEGSNTAGTPAVTRRDGSTSSLDYLYMDHKNSLFTTRFGKMNWAEAYGRESFLSSTDLFLATDAYRAYDSGIGNYRYGVAGTYTFLESHKLTLAISNPNPTATDAGTAVTAGGISTPTGASNNSLAYAAHYSSVMFEKAFQPMLSYTIANQDADSANATGNVSAKFQMMAAGFRTETMGLTVDADWKQFKREKRFAAGTDDKTTSIFANVAYNAGEFTPFVQYANDKFSTETSSASEYKQNTFAGGVMWKPFGDVNFRYHLVYTNINKKYDNVTGTAIQKITDNRVTFGIKADI